LFLWPLVRFLCYSSSNLSATSLNGLLTVPGRESSQGNRVWRDRRAHAGQPLRDPSHVGTVEVSLAMVRDISQRRNRLLLPALRVATARAEV
jgi:hypothetical protein